jgi:hypothetical protein
LNDQRILEGRIGIVDQALEGFKERFWGSGKTLTMTHRIIPFTYIPSVNLQTNLNNTTRANKKNAADSYLAADF